MKEDDEFDFVVVVDDEIDSRERAIDYLEMVKSGGALEMVDDEKPDGKEDGDLLRELSTQILKGASPKAMSRDPRETKKLEPLIGVEDSIHYRLLFEDLKFMRKIPKRRNEQWKSFNASKRKEYDDKFVMMVKLLAGDSEKVLPRMNRINIKSKLIQRKEMSIMQNRLNEAWDPWPMVSTNKIVTCMLLTPLSQWKKILTSRYFEIDYNHDQSGLLYYFSTMTGEIFDIRKSVDDSMYLDLLAWNLDPLSGFFELFKKVLLTNFILYYTWIYRYGKTTIPFVDKKPFTLAQRRRAMDTILIIPNSSIKLIVRGDNQLELLHKVQEELLMLSYHRLTKIESGYFTTDVDGLVGKEREYMAKMAEMKTTKQIGTELRMVTKSGMRLCEVVFNLGLNPNFTKLLENDSDVLFDSDDLIAYWKAAQVKGVDLFLPGLNNCQIKLSDKDLKSLFGDFYENGAVNINPESFEIHPSRGIHSAYLNIPSENPYLRSESSFNIYGLWRKANSFKFVVYTEAALAFRILQSPSYQIPGKFVAVTTFMRPEDTCISLCNTQKKSDLKICINDTNTRTMLYNDPHHHGDASIFVTAYRGGSSSMPLTQVYPSNFTPMKPMQSNGKSNSLFLLPYHGWLTERGKKTVNSETISSMLDNRIFSSTWRDFSVTVVPYLHMIKNYADGKRKMTINHVPLLKLFKKMRFTINNLGIYKSKPGLATQVSQFVYDNMASSVAFRSKSGEIYMLRRKLGKLALKTLSRELLQNIEMKKRTLLVIASVDDETYDDDKGVIRVSSEHYNSIMSGIVDIKSKFDQQLLLRLNGKISIVVWVTPAAYHRLLDKFKYASMESESMSGERVGIVARSISKKESQDWLSKNAAIPTMKKFDEPPAHYVSADDMLLLNEEPSVRKEIAKESLSTTDSTAMSVLKTLRAGYEHNIVYPTVNVILKISKLTAIGKERKRMGTSSNGRTSTINIPPLPENDAEALVVVLKALARATVEKNKEKNKKALMAKKLTSKAPAVEEKSLSKNRIVLELKSSPATAEVVLPGLTSESEETASPEKDEEGKGVIAIEVRSSSDTLEPPAPAMKASEMTTPVLRISVEKSSVMTVGRKYSSTSPDVGLIVNSSQEEAMNLLDDIEMEQVAAVSVRKRNNIRNQPIQLAMDEEEWRREPIFVTPVHSKKRRMIEFETPERKSSDTIERDEEELGDGVIVQTVEKVVMSPTIIDDGDIEMATDPGEPDDDKLEEKKEEWMKKSILHNPLFSENPKVLMRLEGINGYKLDGTAPAIGTTPLNLRLI